MALRIVGEIVQAWDPYDLIANGAPIDEFDVEIGRIVARIHRITSISAAAQVVSEVFSAAFEPHLFAPAQCTAPAQEIFSRLSAARLVS